MTVSTLPIVKTFMHMTTRPQALPAPEVPSDALLLRVVAPELAFYRHLFAAVGEPWLWWTRTLMTDAQLREIVHDPRVQIHALYAEGQPAGFFELDRRSPGDIELAFCGLVPRFIGRRLGSFLLRSAVAYAWAAPNVERVWLHTCTLDHPKAIEFYRKNGFVAFDERIEMVEDPRLSGRMPRNAGWLSPGLPPLAA